VAEKGRIMTEFSEFPAGTVKVDGVKFAAYAEVSEGGFVGAE
jgi:hypothetical protein